MKEMDVEMPDESKEAKESISDSEDEEDALEAQAKELEARIEANNYDYNAHVELLTTLQKLAELDRLRKARNRMSKLFPLTPELWLSWLTDEIKLASTDDEKKAVVDLFERAVKDYQSVDLWLEYAQFNIGVQDQGEVDSFHKIREVFERALTAVGLHVLRGGLIWDAYLEFELYYSSVLATKKEEEPGKTAYINQLKRISILFKRQLSCPLLGIEDSKTRFDDWIVEIDQPDLIDKAAVESIYKTALQKFEDIQPYEAQIMSADNKLEAYKKYIEYEQSKHGLPPRVICLFERAISDGTLCLEPNLWADYIDYVGSTLNSESVLSVCINSLRNVPWCVTLHQSYLRFLEKFNQSSITITAAMEQALISGFPQPTDYRDLWLSYLEYLRRRYDVPDLGKEEEERRLESLREAFGRALTHLGELGDADPDCSVTQYWARIEAIYCKNMEKTRKLWNDILLKEQNNTAAMWLEYINLERAYGDGKHLRKLFPRALGYTRDWPEIIEQAWINYERDEGTLESYLACQKKCKVRIQQINELRNKEQYQQGGKPVPKKGKRAGLGFTEDPKKSIIGYKRKSEREEEVSPKKVRFEDDQKGEKKEATTKDIVDDLLREKETAAAHGAVTAHDSSKDHLTVFVSNLSFEVEENKIKEIFGSIGNITEVRLVRDFKGRSKGFCYVVFKTSREAAEALKKDREKLEGRPMFVSKCDPDRQTRTSGFKFSNRIEKNKLFIKGLPLTTTEEDLRQLFEQYGALKDVRLVTYRNGHSKGLAYVDFEDEVSAAQAIIKTDGSKIGEHEISVAISNPPSRKTTATEPVITSLGGGPKVVGGRGRGRTQMSFVPRNIQLQQSATNSLANLSLASPLPVENGGNKKALSNSEFRDMLLAGKSKD